MTNEAENNTLRPSHLFWPWQGHEDELSLYVPPAGENRDGGEDDEDVSPVEVVGVEAVGQHHGEKDEDEEVEEQPGEEEGATPGADPVACQAEI